MSTIKAHFAALLIIALITCTGSFAQDGPIYTVTTWKVDIPENGSNAELTTLLDEFHQKVTLPNENIVSERMMRHLSGSDSRDLIIITEYANWNDIDAAATRQGELVNTAWETEEARKEFFTKFNKYFLMHTDEIYSGMPALSKN